MNIHVEGATLQSLRKRYKMTVEQASHMTSIDEALLVDWESNGVIFNMTEARRVAKQYHTHWSVFLSQKPVKPIAEPDNHRAGYSDGAQFSMETLRAYEVARHLLDVSIEIDGQEIDSKLATLIGDGIKGRKPDEVAAKIRNQLGVHDEEIIKLNTANKIYSYWKEKISDYGIYISEQEMPQGETKAFLLKDGKRAVIVVNKSDRYIYSRLFSLLHELGHLLSGEKSAACDSTNVAVRSSSEETWCNRFASQLAVPDSTILADNISHQVTSSDDPAALIKRLSNKYGVSFTVILYKLKQHDLVTPAQVGAMQTFFEKVLKPNLEPKKIPGKEIKLGRVFYIKQDVSRASVSLSREVIERQIEGKLSYGEAAKMLNTKATYLAGIKDMVGFGS